MHPVSDDVVWLDARAVLTLAELSEACAMSADALQELVDDGALQPVQQGATLLVFSAECVMPLRKAGRLGRDFDLDLFTVGLLLDHMQRIEVLEAQVLHLQVRLGTPR